MKNKISVLRKRPEFLAVAATGKKFVAPGFILQLGAKREGAAARYGLTATVKIGNAVIRNRARRRLRELACDVLASHADVTRDYVLIARRDTATRDFAAMKEELAGALRKMGAWRE